MRRPTSLMAALFASLFTISSASAASFEATALSTISSVSSGAPYTVFETPAPDGYTSIVMTLGSGAASASGLNDVGLGSQFGTVDGSATFPPVSESFAGVEAHDFIEVDNSLGTGPASLEFVFEYSALLSAVAPLPTEAAWAGFNFHITGADDEPGELLEVDTGSGFVAVSDFEVDETIFASAGSSDLTAVGAVAVRYTVDALSMGGDGIYGFSIFTRVGGAAEAVPEPSTMLSLLGLGICGACWRRRRRS